MRARVERNWMNRTVKIWLYSDASNGGVTIHEVVEGGGGSTFRDVRLEPGVADAAPSIELREDMLEAHLTAAAGVLPASDATTAHLNDTITVRDRLLALVEKKR